MGTGRLDSILTPLFQSQHPPMCMDWETESAWETAGLRWRPRRWEKRRENEHKGRPSGFCAGMTELASARWCRNTFFVECRSKCPREPLGLTSPWLPAYLQLPGKEGTGRGLSSMGGHAPRVRHVRLWQPCREWGSVSTQRRFPGGAISPKGAHVRRRLGVWQKRNSVDGVALPGWLSEAGMQLA